MPDDNATLKLAEKLVMESYDHDCVDADGNVISHSPSCVPVESRAVYLMGGRPATAEEIELIEKNIREASNGDS
jgi:hypothetical protein